jgi:hypothetical protein
MRSNVRGSKQILLMTAFCSFLDGVRGTGARSSLATRVTLLDLRFYGEVYCVVVLGCDAV